MDPAHHLASRPAVLLSCLQRQEQDVRVAQIGIVFEKFHPLFEKRAASGKVDGVTP